MIFLDTEGEPIQEISAIEVSMDDLRILDVYHKHARCTADEDRYSRRHIHGLNPEFLHEKGLCDETALIYDFQIWLKGKPYNVILSNDGRKERKSLASLRVQDLCLPPWLERITESYHKKAFEWKEKRIPVHGTTCNEDAHTLYRRPHDLKNDTAVAKAKHGHHCSLYDCLELYLYFCQCFHFCIKLKGANANKCLCNA